MKKRVTRLESEERDIGERDEIRKSMGKTLFSLFVFLYLYLHAHKSPFSPLIIYKQLG